MPGGTHVSLLTSTMTPSVNRASSNRAPSSNIQLTRSSSHAAQRVGGAPGVQLAAQFVLAVPELFPPAELVKGDGIVSVKAMELLNLAKSGHAPDAMPLLGPMKCVERVGICHCGHWGVDVEERGRVRTRGRMGRMESVVRRGERILMGVTLWLGGATSVEFLSERGMEGLVNLVL